jgi:hypothetical protein
MWQYRINPEYGKCLSSGDDISSDELPLATCTAAYSDFEDVSGGDTSKKNKNSRQELNYNIDDITDVELEPLQDISASAKTKELIKNALFKILTQIFRIYLTW